MQLASRALAAAKIMVTTKLNEFIGQITGEFDQISEERKLILLKLAEFIEGKNTSDEIINLIFVCTHNSRRSHLSQVWAQVAAFHYGIPNVFSYSGGTESTALFPSSAGALAESGVDVQKLTEGTNPVYAFKYEANRPPVVGFSKRYDDSFNPQSGFCAIMTCTQADEGCPFIAGAEQRISLPFEDPKAFDNTPEQQKMYYERSRQIARELFFTFSRV